MNNDSNKSNFLKYHDFYEFFQEHFRGERDEIKKRLSKYKIYLDPLLESENKQVIDLGCGRGEWLELLGAWGFEAKGYDLNDGMLEHCKRYHLNAYKADALEALKEMKDGSIAVISSFHVIEHLTFHEIQLLFAECYRVLMPGGILILETPNTENILVMAETFWLDPSHIHPLPPGLLSFLARYHGFDLNVIIRLNERKSNENFDDINLEDLFYSVSPDCALVALKSKNKLNYEIYEKIFQFSVGRDLKYFITKLDEKSHNKDYIISELKSEIKNLTNKINTINSDIEFFKENILRNIAKRLIGSVIYRIKFVFILMPNNIIMKLILFLLRLIKNNVILFKIIRRLLSFFPSFERKIVSFVRNKLIKSNHIEASNFYSLADVAIYHDDYVPRNKLFGQKAEMIYQKLKCKG